MYASLLLSHAQLENSPGYAQVVRATHPLAIESRCVADDQDPRHVDRAGVSMVRSNNLRSPLALAQTSVSKLSHYLTGFIRSSKSFNTAMTPFLPTNQAIPCDENTPPGEINEDQDVFEQLAIEIIRRAEKVVEDDDTEVVINDILLDRYYAKRLRV